MKFKYIVATFILSLSFSEDVAAENIVALAKETLKLNESANNYFSKKEVSEKFSDIKDYIQTDYKNGNKNARVDIFLLLDGLVQNNLASLQSFLATANNTSFSKEFSQTINYEYAEKLAYALKENKRLLITEYKIENSVHKGKCINYVNGYKISNNHSFFAPAGLPYYIASYCEDKTFAVNKIQSETAQPKFEINLNEYHDAELLSQAVVLSSRGASAEESGGTSETKVDLAVVPGLRREKAEMAITTGLGYNYFSGAIKDNRIYNVGTNYGSIIYSSTSFQYQNLFVAIDIAPINKDVISYQEASTVDGQGSKNTTTVQSVQLQKGFFLRPSLGVNKVPYKFTQNISASLSSNINMTFINTQGSPSYSSTSLGLGMSPTLNFNLEHNFLFNFGVSAGVDFPSPGAEFVGGAVAGVGYTF